MNLFKSLTAPNQNGEGRLYLIPSNDHFLCIESNNGNIDHAELKKSNELSSKSSENHYFDLSNTFNLLPKLSDELINEKALIEFLNWDLNKKVYHFLDEKNSITIHFQTNTLQDIAVSHAIPSVNKHHLSELMLNVSKNNGVHALVFNTQIYITVRLSNQILLCNSFDAKTDEEILYYLLLIYQEKDLSQEETQLIFYGNFPQKPEMTSTYLNTYIRNIELRRFADIQIEYQGIVQLIKEGHAHHQR
ncbi:MAG: DUF3822 family protein [Flavobacteriales bacterium]|nr:DUF3822 family protein [Flavobacteriales bacterium]MCB9196403.1 DUF3822 family protein [Flavobacteriales bacterium]MCB9198429.1 DUF3822 family protein [Flavobacteriales bacterium]